MIPAMPIEELKPLEAVAKHLYDEANPGYWDTWEATRGDKDHFFRRAKKLVKFINSLHVHPTPTAADTPKPGWKLVPIEPTDEMVDAFAEAGTDAREAARAYQHARGIHHPNALAECQWVPAAYRAMLKAAPAQPAAADTGLVDAAGSRIEQIIGLLRANEDKLSHDAAALVERLREALRNEHDAFIKMGAKFGQEQARAEAAEQDVLYWKTGAGQLNNERQSINADREEAEQREAAARAELADMRATCCGCLTPAERDETINELSAREAAAQEENDKRVAHFMEREAAARADATLMADQRDEAECSLAAAREQIGKLEISRSAWEDSARINKGRADEAEDTLSSAREQIAALERLLTEAREWINDWADTAKEHDLIARIDALAKEKNDGQ